MRRIPFATHSYPKDLLWKIGTETVFFPRTSLSLCQLWFHRCSILLHLRSAGWTRCPLQNFFFHWHYSPLWASACRTMSFHFFLSATNSLHLLTTSTWKSLSTSSFHLFLDLPLLLVPSSYWVKIFLGILSSSTLSRWPNQLIICQFVIYCPSYTTL